MPYFLEKSFGLLEDIPLISNREKRFLLRNIYLSVEETDIVSILDKVCEKFKGVVHLGSYPDFSDQDFKSN